LTYEGTDYGEIVGDAGVVAATATIAFTALVGETIDLSARPNGPLAEPLPAPPDVPSWPTYPSPPTVDETNVEVYKDDDVTD
jgi:hypothetical protein